MKIELPQNVAYIIEQLNNAGYEASAVGGCVRDSILGREPNDWDITTSATPQEVKKVFKRTFDTGIQHGTITVLLKGEGYEVTTYRIDGEYTDHRRPDEVHFTRKFAEDLLRRDFTINAMAYNEKDGLIDLYGGVQDLNDGIIKCVGNPDDRFNEDALRIMRAVRFAAQLGFDIDEDTWNAAKNHAGELRDISAERIETELTKLLVSDHPEKLIDMYELGITAVILPEFDLMMQTEQNSKYHIYDVGRHTVEVIKNVRPDKVMRYSALLHDSGKPACKTTDEDGTDHFKGHNLVSEEIAGKVLKRLRMDNDTIRDVKKLVYWHDYGINGNLKLTTVRKMLSMMGENYFDDLIELKRADNLGQSDYNSEINRERIDTFIKYHNEIMENQDALTIKDLKITGKDLIDAGIKPGPDMGRILKILLEIVLNEPEHNDHEWLLDKAMKLQEE